MLCVILLIICQYGYEADDLKHLAMPTKTDASIGVNGWPVFLDLYGNSAVKPAILNFQHVKVLIDSSEGYS